MANRDLTPWRAAAPTPFGRDPFMNFRREMDRLFDDFFAPAEPRSFGGGATAQSMVMPSIDVHETDQAYTISAELPGIDPKDVELDLRDNALTLRGEKRSEKKEEDGGRRYSERSFGRFERTIPLAAEVDADNIEARFENGLLKVMLPKNAKARDKTRRIEIKGGSKGGA
ncbi:MAG TPA: Hsp20/alpha crystallin family protein [Phenylobacterium sp.]|uniref:Hsp20/alpha crystallin family protein n=1 Tax=Phenylobacterium sp. TaxID=1871053 RepID=UPI002B490680|nr:Hsp20/alpha crystallin family protein [Phenylobacterium sp.]HKR88903.1 Hsp20/alpha crystallin family protein [Phenylobacterium sp.]